MSELVNKIVRGARRVTYSVPARPASAQFEVTNRCNLNCAMCPRTKFYKVKIIDMEYDLYAQALEKLVPLRLATLTGWGEPLLHKRLYDMIALARRKGVPEVSVTSNGVLFNDEHIARLLDCGLTQLRVSVDNLDELRDGDNTGHAGGAQIMEKVETLLKRRRGKFPRTVLAVTIYPDNRDAVFKLIDRAAAMGMDGVALMRMNDRFDESLSRYSFDEEGRVCAEYKAHARRAGISMGTPRDIHAGLRRFFYLNGTKCPVTFDGVYITAEGIVTPCCALPKLNMGNILESDIESIWNSRKFKHFRDNQDKPCAHCDLLDARYKSR